MAFSSEATGREGDTMINPSNSLKEQIEQIQDYCERLIPDRGEHASWFRPAATEEEIAEWERTHSTTIPESYKDWLRFANGCQIASFTATFYSLNGTDSDEKAFPADWILIGDVIGDGELIFFSKSSQKFIRYFEATVHEFDEFSVILNDIVDMLKGDCGEETMSEEELKSFMALIKKSEERKAREAKEAKEGV